MCDNCINRLFLSGPGPCPFCKTTLRRSNFVVQTFEDLLVEKEVQVRKKVGRYFNKRLEDFPNLRAYNDYLEQSEDLIFNLIHNIDVQATNEKIERYRVENKDQIAASLAKQVAEDKALQQQLLREKKEKQLRKEAYLNQAIEEEKSRKHEKLELMNQIASADSTAKIKLLLKESKSKRVEQPAFKPIEVIKVKLEDTEMDLDQELEVEDANYTPMEIVNNPIEFVLQSSYTCRYSIIYKSWTGPLMKEHGDVCRAGGYMPSLTFSRALKAATSGLLL